MLPVTRCFQPLPPPPPPREKTSSSLQSRSDTPASRELSFVFDRRLSTPELPPIEVPALPEIAEKEKVVCIVFRMLAFCCQCLSLSSDIFTYVQKNCSYPVGPYVGRETRKQLMAYTITMNFQGANVCLGKMHISLLAVLI